MRQIASIEINVIVRELQPLVGTYLKKFYDLKDGSFRLLFQSKEQNAMVYIKLLQTINLTTMAEEVEEPTNFAKAVRKRIMGKKLGAIKQRYSDRIVIFEFEGEEGYKLIVEMFGQGNLVITDKAYEILAAYESVRQKGREIAPHAVYQFPESIKFNIEAVTETQIQGALDEIKQTNERIIKELSRRIDVGPIYLEDVLIRSETDPKAKANEPHDYKLIAENMQKFFDEAKNPKPTIYKKGEEYADYAIVPIEKYKGYEQVQFDSLSKALEEFYKEGRVKVERNDEELNEIKANIERQKQLIQELIETEKASNEAGHKLLAEMNMVNEIIDYVNQKRRVTIEELREKFGDRIKAVDLKNKSVVIEM